MIFQEYIPFPSNFPSTNNIIIDCDTGGDDAQAIILCFHLAKKYNKKIVGIFCCEGNCSI
jgi:inosine-uridine nucleoside N-ribohydrolase